MDMVVELFQKLGPKIIVVVKSGHLKGLITKKDVLRHIEDELEE